MNKKMKKITNFIIDKRYFILIIAIVFTIVSGIASQSVTINYDIAKYLPDTSKTRIGMNLMEEEFKEETSTLNIMFANLKSNEKTAIKKELAQISGVKSVTYDKTNTYNKGKYTLYILTIDGKNDSPTAKKAYQQIRQAYQEQNPAMSGDVYESNKTVLPLWIVVLAVGCALLM